MPVILFVLVETSCAYALKKDSVTGNISKYIEESDNKDQNDFNQYDSLTRLFDKPVESDVLEEDNKIIYKIPDENGIEREYVFTAIWHNNNAFNTLTALDISTCNQGEIKLDKSPIELVSNFLKTAKQSIYYDTLQKRDALNVTWSNDTQRRTYTEWFYDTAELEKYYKKGFAKAKEDLGYDPDNSSIIINNDINGFL